MKVAIIFIGTNRYLDFLPKYYDRDGNVVIKNFCDKDWTAIKRLRAIGIPVLFITGDPYNEMILSNRRRILFK